MYIRSTSTQETKSRIILKKRGKKHINHRMKKLGFKNNSAIKIILKMI